MKTVPIPIEQMTLAQHVDYARRFAVRCFEQSVQQFRLNCIAAGHDARLVEHEIEAQRTDAYAAIDAETRRLAAWFERDGASLH